MKNFKEFCNENKIALCAYYIVDTEQCKIGCINTSAGEIKPKNVCPFEGRPENMNKEDKVKEYCYCYKE